MITENIPSIESVAGTDCITNNDVVDVNEVGDDLENAEIIGDLPEEVEI